MGVFTTFMLSTNLGKSIPTTTYHIGLGDGPVGPLLAGPLFCDLMKFIIFINCVNTLCAIIMPDHFISPSYTPALDISLCTPHYKTRVGHVGMMFIAS